LFTSYEIFHFILNRVSCTFCWAQESFKVKGAKTERRVFLFRRLLLLVKKKGEHLQYKGSIPIETVTVGDVIKGSGHSFVVTKLSNQDISYELEARTEGIKSNWTGTIKRLMLDAHSPPIQKPYTETVHMTHVL
jgi:hypothetical protein